MCVFMCVCLCMCVCGGGGGGRMWGEGICGVCLQFSSWVFYLTGLMDTQSLADSSLEIGGWGWQADSVMRGVGRQSPDASNRVSKI